MDDPARRLVLPGRLARRAAVHRRSGRRAGRVPRMRSGGATGCVALAFVAAIPYTKADAHAVELREPGDARPAGRPAPAAGRPSGRPAGYGVARRLLADAPARSSTPARSCGNCHAACPANATGLPLSPRDVVLDLREQANDAFSAPASAASSARCCGRLRRTGSTRRSSARTACARRPSGRACSATRASRPARSASSRRRSSTSCAAAWSRRASSTGDCRRRCEAFQKSGNSFGEHERKRGRLDGRAGLRGPRRAHRDRRGALVRRRLRVVRPALAARLAHARAAAAGRRRRLRDPLRRRAQRRQRRAPRRGGGPLRVAGRGEHRGAVGLRLPPHPDDRPAFAEHAAQRVPRARRRVAGRATTRRCCSS